MNEAKRNEVTSYLEERSTQYKGRIQALYLDDRTDEAIFAKVQMNVYDIFTTIFSAALKTAGEDDGEVVRLFLTKIQQIPQSWHTSLQKAQEHGDADKAHIEYIKLEIVAEIKTAFERIWEVMP